MLSWIVACALTVIPPLIPEGAPIAPTDISVGHQHIALRAPLVARSSGARLVLFVRDLKQFDGNEADRIAAFERAVPSGSVSAELTAESGQRLKLEHTEYVYYKGFAGLVLTEQVPGLRATRYITLDLDARLALPGVRFVWLDQSGRDVRDLQVPR